MSIPIVPLVPDITLYVSYISWWDAGLLGMYNGVFEIFPAISLSFSSATSRAILRASLFIFSTTLSLPSRFSWCLYA